jgi:hypothetical protein
MLLITFVELLVVAGRSRRRAGSPQAVSRRPCCVMALRRTAWSEHGMGAAWTSVNQTRPHCVNQMRKTHSKPLRCPYTYESGSRVRLGELDPGARLGYISPHTHEWIPARDTPHTDEFDSLEPEPIRTGEPDSYVYDHL